MKRFGTVVHGCPLSIFTTLFPIEVCGNSLCGFQKPITAIHTDIQNYLNILQIGWYCGIVFVHCKHLLLSTINKELTGLQLGRKRLGRRARLGGHWEGGRSLGSQEKGTEEADVHSKPHGRTQIKI